MPTDFIVVDTNVVSYNFKKDMRGELYEPHLRGITPLIAAQTLAEIELMPLLNNWSERRHAALRLMLKKYVVLETDQQICLLWAAIQASTRRKGRVIAVGDTWIAATALAYGAPLLTHDPDDFKEVDGLTIVTEKKSS